MTNPNFTLTKQNLVRGERREDTAASTIDEKKTCLPINESIEDCTQSEKSEHSQD